MKVKVWIRKEYEGTHLVDGVLHGDDLRRIEREAEAYWRAAVEREILEWLRGHEKVSRCGNGCAGDCADGIEAGDYRKPQEGGER